MHPLVRAIITGVFIGGVTSAITSCVVEHAYGADLASVSQSDNAAYAVVNGGGGGSGGGVSEMHESGHLYGTPSVGGSYSAFANPCGLSSSASGAGGPIGLSVSLASEGTGCTLRAMTSLWGVIGASVTKMPPMFLAITEAQFCQDKHAALAFYEGSGSLCPGTDASIIPIMRTVPKGYVAQGIPGSTERVSG